MPHGVPSKRQLAKDILTLALDLGLSNDEWLRDTRVLAAAKTLDINPYRARSYARSLHATNTGGHDAPAHPDR